MSLFYVRMSIGESLSLLPPPTSGGISSDYVGGGRWEILFGEVWGVSGLMSSWFLSWVVQHSAGPMGSPRRLISLRISTYK